MLMGEKFIPWLESCTMNRHVLGMGVECAEGFELHSSFPSMHDTYNTLHTFTTVEVIKNEQKW